MSGSLWGDLSNIDDYGNPLDILKEQSGYLLSLTNNIIYGDITTRDTRPDWLEPDYKFATTFKLRSKSMQNYDFELFTIYYDITFFPMTIMLEEGFAEAAGIPIENEFSKEKQFHDYLAMILSHNRTVKIIKSMYVLSK